MFAKTRLGTPQYLRAEHGILSGLTNHANTAAIPSAHDLDGWTQGVNSPKTSLNMALLSSKAMASPSPRPSNTAVAIFPYDHTKPVGLGAVELPHLLQLKSYVPLWIVET